MGVRPLASEYADPRGRMQPVARRGLTIHTAGMGKRIVVAAGAVAVALVVVGVLLQLRPGGSPAPAPTALGREAVLLIPGYGGDPAPLGPLRSALLAQGYEVAVLDIGDGTGDLVDYAANAVQRAEELRGEGHAAVSSVGYSAGGVVGRIAADQQPAAFDDVISLASPHAGTLWAALAGPTCPTACQQMRPGSALLASLPPAPDPSDWLAVYSTADEIIVPADSSALPGATVLTLQSMTPDSVAGHGQVPGDPAVIDAVVTFLAAPD